MTSATVFRTGSSSEPVELKRHTKREVESAIFEKRDLSAELREDATEIAGGTAEQLGDAQWTPNCLVRRHNSGVERIAGISSCLGFVRKLAITQTSSRLGDIVKIAIFALANVALAIFDVVKGAFTVIKSVVTKIICCGRNTATPPAEEPLTEEQLVDDLEDEVDDLEDEVDDLKAANARFKTQELAMNTLSDRLDELARRSSEDRLRGIESVLAKTETAVRDNAQVVGELRGAVGVLQGGFRAIEKDADSIKGIDKSLTIIDNKASVVYRGFGELDKRMTLLEQRMPPELMPMSQRPTPFSNYARFPETGSFSSSGSLAPLSSSSSSSGLPASSSSSSSSSSTSRLVRQQTLDDRLELVEGGLRDLTTAVRSLNPSAPATATVASADVSVPSGTPAGPPAGA